MSSRCAEIIHEALLRIALASIPIAATIIHPALGMATALGVVILLRRILLRPEGAPQP